MVGQNLLLGNEVTNPGDDSFLVFQAGAIMLVDLSSRKCVAELCAPQSIHEVEVLQLNDSTDLLVISCCFRYFFTSWPAKLSSEYSNFQLTSFTGAQWIIPLENNGRSITEVLTACIPSEFRKAFSYSFFL